MGGTGGVVEPPGMVEICGNAADEDTMNDACPQNVANWHARFGDQAMQRVRRVAISTNGDVVIAGEYDGTVDIGSPVFPSVSDLTGAGKYQAFVARFGPDGSPKWIFNDGSTIEGTALDVAVPNNDMPPNTTDDTYWTGLQLNHATVSKISNSGMLDIVWSTGAFDQAPGSRGNAIIKPFGNTLYVAGTVQGVGLIDCTDIPDPTYDSPTPRLFLAALDATDALKGVCKWAKIYDGGDIDPESVRLSLSANGMTADPVIAGTYRKRIDGSTWPDVPSDRTGVFFIQANATNGTIVRSRGYTTTGAGEIKVRQLRSVPVMGNMVITGAFRGKFDTNLNDALDPTSTSGDTSTDAFVMNVNVATDFDVRWINRFGGADIQEGTGVAVASGNIYATGITYGPMSPDPATTLGQMCPPNGGKCMYWLEMLGDTGKVVWAESIGSKDAAANANIDVIANNTNVVLAGGWSLPLDFGTGTSKPAKGNLDIFLASYTAASLP